MSSFLTNRKTGEGKEEMKETSGDSSPARRASTVTKGDSGDRINKLLDGVAGKSPPWLANFLKKAAPVIVILCQIANVVGPYILMFYMGIYKVYKMLPKNVIAVLSGLALCFFGGFFAVSIAAIEAFNASGGDRVWEAVAALKEDMKLLHAANKKDDDRDDDGDGVKDVDQISSQQLITRKFGLAMRTVDPDRVTDALSGIYTGYLGVLVILKFQFARTVSLAISIGDCMRPLAADFVTPALAFVIPKEYHNWIPHFINYTCKFIAMTIAWWIQRIISTVQSAIKGGLIFSRALLRLANEKGVTTMNHEDTNLDEVVGWAVAALGIYVQLSLNWNLPFYVDIWLWPLHVMESFLKWSVTWLDATPPQ